MLKVFKNFKLKSSLNVGTVELYFVFRNHGNSSLLLLAVARKPLNHEEVLLRLFVDLFSCSFFDLASRGLIFGIVE